MNKAIPRVLAVCGPGSPELSSPAGGEVPFEHLCKAFGYQVATYAVGNLKELTRTIRFLGCVAHLPKYQAGPLVLHISIDGNSVGMEVGPDKATWEQLTRTISETFADLESYPGPTVLVLAARGACKTELTRLLRQHGDSPTRVPNHLFLIVERVHRWVDAMLLWSHFYGETAQIDFTAHSVMDLPILRRLDSRLQRLALAKLSYFGRLMTPGSVRAPDNSAHRN